MTDERTPIVVVGVDDSEHSTRALRWADRYAQATGGSLRVVVAWQWAVAYGRPMVFEGYDPDLEAGKVAEKAIIDLATPRDRITIQAPEDAPGEALVKASADADLLVVGRHGHRSVGSLLVGSVSNYCLHHATVPVVVVH
jgi:nucleotide-binding universal stress UspA family protein